VENAAGVENAPRFPPPLGQPAGLPTFPTAPAAIPTREEGTPHGAKGQEPQVL